MFASCLAALPGGCRGGRPGRAEPPIDILKTFGLIWALFGNATITRVMPIHIYTVGIQTQDYSGGAVLSLILAAVSILVYWAFQRGFGRRALAQE